MSRDFRFYEAGKLAPVRRAWTRCKVWLLALRRAYEQDRRERQLRHERRPEESNSPTGPYW